VLRNVFGFEYLIAPYTIAHLKLSQYLKDKGLTFSDTERLRIYLTNTLEPIAPQRNFLLPALSAEAEAAQKVKQQPILVITGNPPYSGHSRNKGAWATRSVEAYRKGFPELSKPGQGKWLQDDYVKFIRFAQMKMDKVPEGIVGIITNHSFLDNPTFRGMRQSLMASFDRIYLLDLHGNAKKKEHAPDGGKDENVFDIEQGVAISLFIKTCKPIERGVFRADLWGDRLGKYEWAARTRFLDVKWQTVCPSSPQWMFALMDTDLLDKYQKFHAVSEIFKISGDPAPGIVTTHDEFAISFSRNEAISKARRLTKTRDEKEARELFRLCSQSQWDYAKAKKFLSTVDLAELVRPISYRPFDERWTIWSSHVAVHRRERIMSHMLRDNVALLTCRQVSSGLWQHAYSVENISESTVVSNRTKEITYSFPLYLYPPEDGARRRKGDLFGEDDPFAGKERIENISAAFRAELARRYGEPKFTPEQVFGYVYAILHAPSYRARYAEFLRIDFPRIPLVESQRDFQTLADLGWSLAQIHLMKTLPRSKLGKYQGSGDDKVEKPCYAEAEQAVYINASQKFAPIPPKVWNFQIGGYQVLEKYLKSRKGRTLSLDEVSQIERITAALEATITCMAKIDTAYRASWPPITAGKPRSPSPLIRP
jgi:predicted helicase